MATLEEIKKKLEIINKQDNFKLLTLVVTDSKMDNKIPIPKCKRIIREIRNSADLMNNKITFVLKNKSEIIIKTNNIEEIYNILKTYIKNITLKSSSDIISNFNDNDFVIIKNIKDKDIILEDFKIKNIKILLKKLNINKINDKDIISLLKKLNIKYNRKGIMINP